MRKIQNIISNFGNVIARQGNKLVVRIEALRSLRATFSEVLALKALASITLPSYALSSHVMGLASWLRNDAWQSLSTTWTSSHLCVAPVVVKQSRRHLSIMCRRTAA